MIIIHLSNIKEDAVRKRKAHVRVVINEPKKRDPLDHSIVNRKAEFIHFAPEGKLIPEWLIENYAFKRCDPTPLYRLSKEHLYGICRTDVEFDPKNCEVGLKIPQTSPTPKVRILDLGTYIGTEGIPGEHSVVGFYTEDVLAEFINEDRRETVCYMLETADVLVERRFIDHLDKELTAKGFATLVTPKKSEG